MVLRKLFERLTQWKEAKNEYPNRFLKFYHLNKKRLQKERNSAYSLKKERGICVRCRRKASEGIIFCEYHQQKQVEYNKKARSK